MIFSPTTLKGAYTVTPQPFTDERGWFARYFCKQEFATIGHEKEFVQMNHSVSHVKGTLRGMHYQASPFQEIKLVRCIAGSIWDVIVDIREGSPTFLQTFGVELSAANKTMLYIPEGFAHGFQCLTDACELLYHHTAYYQPGVEAGIRYSDPLIGIDWPLAVTSISQRDAAHPFLTNDFKGI